MERTFTARALSSAKKHTGLAPGVTVYETAERVHLFARACPECFELIDARAKRCTYCTAQIEPALDIELVRWLASMLSHSYEVLTPFAEDIRIYRDPLRRDFIGVRACPHCAWRIDAEADHCSYCKREVEPLVTPGQIEAYMQEMARKGNRQLLIAVTLIVGLLILGWLISVLVNAP
jgi:hypothetical protein